MKKILVLIGEQTDSKEFFIKCVKEILTDLKKKYTTINISDIVNKDKKQENEDKMKAFHCYLQKAEDIIILEDGFLNTEEQARYLKNLNYEIIILKLGENRETKKAERYLINKHCEYYLLTLSQSSKEGIADIVSEIVSIRK